MKNCLTETRNAVHELKETKLNFLQAVTNLISKTERDQLIKFQIRIDEKIELFSFSEQENKLIYRIFQEALTNAMRYSTRKEILVEMKIENNTQLTFLVKNFISSNYSWHEGFGIMNMRD